jgi:hypothetical protein
MRNDRDEDFRNQNMNQSSGRTDRDRSSTSDRFQAEDDNYSMRNREPQQRYSDNYDEETPRRARGQTESWSEDIDEDIESPRSTPRHRNAGTESSNAKSNQGRGLRANQSQNQNWGDVTDEEDFDEADEDMYASGNNEEDEEDYDEEEDHRSNSRRQPSHY